MKLENSKRDKGLSGEKYVASEISKLGYKVLYVGGCQLYNITGNHFYSVDLESFKDGFTFWVQVKSKEPRKYYPDTGMELWRYKKLIEHQKESGLPVMVLFTDKSKKIYGEWLDNLVNCVSNLGNQHNTKDNCEMIYWFVKKLTPLKSLFLPPKTLF